MASAEHFNRYHCQDLRQSWPQLTDPLPDQPAPFFLGMARIRAGFISPVEGHAVRDTHWLHLQLAGDAMAMIEPGVEVGVPAGHAVLHSSDQRFPIVRYRGKTPGLIYCIILTGTPARLLADAPMRVYGSVYCLAEDHPAVSPLLALGRPRPHASPHPAIPGAHGAKLVLDLLTALHAIGQASVRPGSGGPGVLEALTQHPDMPLAAVASQYGCSREHLSRSFHRLHGLSPAAYRRRLRLQQALGLFPSDLNLDAIARKVGFATRSGFQRAFLREFGVTPRAMRRRG